MTMSILNVAYPFAPVHPETAGGAEQIVGAIDSALVKKGHRSIVIASAGSAVRGYLIPTPAPIGSIDAEARRFARRAHREAIRRALDEWDIDLIHMHGFDFIEYLPPPGLPVLVTLHLPLSWYEKKSLQPERPNTYLHCVSASQRMTCDPEISLLPEIENGVPVEKLYLTLGKRDFALVMGRICPEKGFHIALDAGSRAGIPVILAGQLFRYEEHKNYYVTEIVARMGGMHRYVGPLSFERKRRFLSAARCLLIPSLAPETSSLVAMEALACGTPVIAFPSGALKDLIEDGRTGFLVKDEREMAAAIEAAAFLDPQDCRQAARERFSSEKMIDKYFACYEKLISTGINQKERRSSMLFDPHSGLDPELAPHLKRSA